MMSSSYDAGGYDDGVGKTSRGTAGNVGGHHELAEVGGTRFLAEAQPPALGSACGRVPVGAGVGRREEDVARQDGGGR
jgi:hypothetical protein